MLTETDLQAVCKFFADRDQVINCYGAATLPNRQGTLILNALSEKPPDYFFTYKVIHGELCFFIDGIPFTGIKKLTLTKKYRDSDKTTTIFLPLKTTEK